MGGVRKAAVAGSWYPGTAAALGAAVDGHLANADRDARDVTGTLTALICPHAGLMYSGPVAAYAYRLLRGRSFDVAILVGPSHFVGFDGVSIYPSGGFETPYGVAPIDQQVGQALLAESPIVREHPAAHAREHSLEMQLPFLSRVLPDATIVPLVMGHQRRETAYSLGEAIGAALRGRRAILVASTDLSHYRNAATAAKLDNKVMEHVSRFDADGLMTALEGFPEHACGGGPTVAVMVAARALGASDARVLKYGDSGDVSGDKDAVVGYLAAAFGSFPS